MEKKKINISTIQINTVIRDKKTNFKKIKKILSEVKQTDIIVLPEVWATGWVCEDFVNISEELENSETVKFLAEIAKEKNSNIIGGSFITKRDNKYYNTCPILNRQGKLIGLYDKMHLYSYYGSEEGQYLTQGENPIIIDIEGIKIGLTICYDIRFPELFRAYRLAGADIITNVAAWSNTKPIPWDAMTKSRAIENQTFLVAANQVGPIFEKDYNLGHSRIIDYNGNVLSELLTGEGVIQSQIDINEMYKFREKCTILNDIKESYEVKII